MDKSHFLRQPQKGIFEEKTGYAAFLMSLLLAFICAMTFSG